MKLPDFFYIKQTRALNNLHDFSVELLTGLYRRNNPNNAYDSEWGVRQIRNLEVSINLSQVVSEGMIGRLLRQRIQRDTNQIPELERDMLRMETIQANIEYELGQLYLKKAAMTGWIQAALLLALLLSHLIQL